MGRGAQGMGRQHGKRGCQGRRTGRKLPSTATTEEGRNGEEGCGNSFRLPGWDYTSPPQKSPKKPFREGETSRRDTAYKSLPVAFPGGSRRQSRSHAGAGNLCGPQLSHSGSPALPRSHLSHHRTVVSSLSWPYNNAAGSTLQHWAGALTTSLPVAAHHGRKFHESGIAYGPWWVT